MRRISAKVNSSPFGTRNYYCLATEGFMDARRWLDQFWSEALRRLKIVAENLPEGDEDA